MGEPQEKITDEPRYIQAQELMTNQTCPKCGHYFGVEYVTTTYLEAIAVDLVCTKCGYTSKRELI